MCGGARELSEPRVSTVETPRGVIGHRNTNTLFCNRKPQGRYSATPPLLREPTDDVLLEESMGEKGLGSRRDPVHGRASSHFFLDGAAMLLNRCVSKR